MEKPVFSGELGLTSATNMNMVTLDTTYYEAITKMEWMGVNLEYVQGWIGGYLRNPKREKPRITEAYEAGYEDGKEKNIANLGNWTK